MKSTFSKRTKGQDVFLPLLSVLPLGLHSLLVDLLADSSQGFASG